METKLLKIYAVCNGKELLILWLYMLGYRQKHIAEHLEMTEGAIRILFKRIRDRVRKNERHIN